MNSSIRMDEYCDEAYIHLGIYVNKLLSAWTEVWIDTLSSRERFWLPGVVLGRFSRFMRFRKGLVIYITRQVCPTTITLVFRSHLMGAHRRPNASVAGIWPISLLKVVYYGSRGSFSADLSFF